MLDALRLYWDWRGWFRPDVPADYARREFGRRVAVTREALTAKYPGVEFEDLDLGGVRGELLNASGDPNAPVLFYAHGGAWRVGSVEDYRGFALRFSYRLKLRVVTFDYRLTPEHAFPAAYEDTVTAYRWARERFGDALAYVGGDSAGGNLGLSLLCNAGLPAPRSAFFLSPATDASGGSRSIRTNYFRDAAIRPAALRGFAASYVGAHDARDPRISPLFAPMSGLPKTLILAGGAEVLRDDSVRFAERARQVGAPVTLVVVPGQQHAWPLMFPTSAPARQAMQTIANFLALPARPTP